MNDHIKRFQSKNGLKVNGIVNKETALKIGEKLSLDRKELINFLGQIDAITSFEAKRENTNFSKIKLKKEYSDLFDDRRIKMYLEKPQAIANRCYANKYGNRGEDSGDGYNFRGNGFFKLKGRDFHVEFSKFVGVDCVENTDLIIDEYLFENAKYFFEKHKLWDSMREVSIEKISQTTEKLNKLLNITHRELKKVDNRIEKVLMYEKMI